MCRGIGWRSRRESSCCRAGVYREDCIFAGRPIIGIVGGIGAGKSYIAKIFVEQGGHVINSDEQVARAYGTDEVKETLRKWWGDDAFKSDGSVDKRAVARRVFSEQGERRKLEGLLHPLVAKMRQEEMNSHAGDPAVTAWVWDTPLLLETGLDKECDAVVFVEADEMERQKRVREGRGWSAEELARREKSQMPLDKKRQQAKYMIRNTAGAADVRSQVREVFSRIVSGAPEMK